MKHNNVAIFVPHLGCPNMCSFCNQRTISGVEKQLSEDDIESVLQQAANEIEDKTETEIAFFGGSFTAIERNYMISLLKIAKKYLDEYGFKGIRLSTRPDAINDEILTILKEYGVTAIELGAQSMNDKTLQLNRRGHTADDIRMVSKLIKQYGISLGLQMMTGLYGEDSKEDIFYTAREIIKLKPDTVRIYPTVVLKGTYLAELYEEGIYRPISLEETVEACAELIEMFEENGIKIIKLGLHSSTDVEKDMVAGVYHPSFRELCEAQLYYKKMCELLKNKQFGEYTIVVNPKEISKAKGNRKANEKKLKEIGYTVKIVTDEKMKSGKIELCE